MTKTLQEIQEFNRQKILCAVHNIEDYEEALQLELQEEDCLINANVDNGKRLAKVLTFDPDLGRNTVSVVYLQGRRQFCYIETTYNNPEIIGKPITLSRVLLSLENSFDGEDGCFGLNFHHGLFDSWWITLSKSTMGIIEDWICKWDLTKETLEEQSEECQKAVYELLGGKNDK